MKANKFFTAVASLMAAVAFTACSNEELENQPVKSQAKQINLTTSLAKTRAASNIQEDAITSQVGVFGVSNGASTADVGNNVEYTVNSGSLSSTSAMTWPSDGSTSVSFYGYAPYNSEWAYGSVNAFSVATDQSEESAYLASDLLYGVPATNPVSQTDDAVNLAFTHKLAKLTITVNRASGCTVDLSNAVVTITGTNTKTSLNPSTGALAETPSVVADIKAGTLAAETGGEVSAIVVPQEIAKDAELIKVATGEKTYIAKLGAAATLASGNAYALTVTVDNSTTPVTTYTLNLGTSLTGWTTTGNTLDVTTSEQIVYEVGDYVLNDGSLLKADASDFDSKKSNIVAVIFSTSVSTTDTAYDGYAMCVKSVSNKDWGQTAEWNQTNITTWANALTDLDGLSHSQAFLTSDTYSGLDSEKQGKFIANFTGFSMQWGTVPANLSGWFVPSIGQWIQILNNLGEAGLSSSTDYADSNSSSPGLTSTETSVFTKIDAYLTKAGQNALGENLYVTSTEAGNNFWQVSKSSTGYNIGRNPGKSNNTRNVIPCVAYKIPTE